MLDKTIKEEYLLDLATPNSQNLHSTLTKELQKYADMNEELIRIWQLKMACIVVLVLSTVCIIRKEATRKSKTA
jgi:hypothetical protein